MSAAAAAAAATIAAAPMHHDFFSIQFFRRNGTYTSAQVLIWQLLLLQLNSTTTVSFQVLYSRLTLCIPSCLRKR